MKRLIPACILAFFITILCIFAYFVTENRCEDAERALNFCETALKKGDVDVGEKAVRFAELWEDSGCILSAFTAHGILDEISYSAARLCGFAESGENAQALAECAEIRQFLKQLYEEQRFGKESFY